MKWNVPNAISFFRVVLVPVLMAFLLADIKNGDLFALAVFVLAAASDSLDGYLARRFRQTTALGAFLDPLADKLLVAAALLSLIQLNYLSAWVAMVVLAREFAVTGLRMVAAVQGTVIAASKWGKAKTASQMLAIAVLIVEPRWITPHVNLRGPHISWYLVMLMLVLTVVSGVDYFLHARGRIQAPPNMGEDVTAAGGGDEPAEPGAGGGEKIVSKPGGTR
jgi:CDP-diacylglycerol---glycerol-3-phosphate 3-phosphatidyltransferase